MLHTYSPSAHRSLLAPALGLLGFCGALLAAPAAHAQVTNNTPKIEAENPTNTLTGTGIVVATTITGFSGTGYVDFNGKPTSLTIPYMAAAAGFYDIVIRYESQYGTTSANDAKIGALSINGGAKNPVYFNSTKTGATFRSTTARRISLNAGSNTITISDNAYGYFGIDFVQIAASAAVPTPLVPTAAGRVEAEAGQIFAAQALTMRDDDTDPHSGSGYVSQFSTRTAENASITLPVTVAAAGLYQVAVGAREIYGGKSFDTQVTTSTSAGSKLTTQLPAGDPADGAPNPFVSYPVAKYNMTAGLNTITITSQTGYLEVDYVDITPTTGVATAARASAEAQKALSAYPNPTNGQALTVSLELASAQETTFDLVNALGQRVSTATRNLRAGANQLQLPTVGVSGGIYQLVVRSGDQPTLVQRVVVN